MSSVQYYGHREKLKHIDRETDVEKLNKSALRIAREVADATGTLMAGNLCNTCVYQQDNPEAIATATSMFKVFLDFSLIHDILEFYNNVHALFSKFTKNS